METSYALYRISSTQSSNAETGMNMQICKYCDQVGHSINNCNSIQAVNLKLEMEQFANNNITERYQNIYTYILSDPWNNSLYEKLMSLAKIELAMLNYESEFFVSKKTLAANYIVNCIRTTYIFYARGSQPNRRMSVSKMKIMMAEMVYWENIAEGISDEVANRILERDIQSCLAMSHKEIYKFNIATVLKVYNRIDYHWEYGTDLTEIKDTMIDCPVCLETQLFTQCVSLKCDHQFCGTCFEKILEKCSIEYNETKNVPTCPLCRENVSEIICTDPQLFDCRIGKYCISAPFIKNVCITPSHSKCPRRGQV